MERHRGATVAHLGLDEVNEIYSLRTALERLAAEWLCRNATSGDFKRMAEVLGQFDKLARPLTRSAVAGLDVAFHDAVYQAAHHERLYQAWLALRSQISCTWCTGVRCGLTSPTPGYRTTRITSRCSCGAGGHWLSRLSRAISRALTSAFWPPTGMARPTGLPLSVDCRQ